MALPVSKHRHVAVLDVGKSNAKLVLFDLQEGRETAARVMPNEVRSDGPYPHFDVDRIFDFALGAMAELARYQPVNAVSITTHGAAAALLAGSGLALPVLDYEFAGPDTLASLYDQMRPEFAETFSPRLPLGLNLGAQLFWQARTCPAAFSKADRLVTYPQYWAWRLTGISATEVTSLGCHTDLWNPRRQGFSKLVSLLGLGAIMAPTRFAFDQLGPVLPDVARHIGLPAGVPVYCGIHDSNASLLPHLLARQPPFAVVSTGTWVIVLAVGSSLECLDEKRDTLANIDAFGRPVPSARFMGGREYELITAGAADDFDDKSVRRVLENQVMMLPSLVEGSGPYPHRKGGWADGQNPSSPGEAAAAATFYLALMTETCLGLASAQGPTVIEGPMAKNNLYCQTLATLTRRAVIPSGGTTGTGAGAALLACGCKTDVAKLQAAPTGGPGLIDSSLLGKYAEGWKSRVRSVPSA
ncbi:MAG TPA: carbohydrate kinase [Verrucomicrobiae bacterium]|nr:carbohydrate kinase [Verrucomicrobiae bacterium]